MLPILKSLTIPSTLFSVFLPNFSEPTSQITFIRSVVGIPGSCPPTPAYHSPSAPTHLGTFCLFPGRELLFDSSLGEDLGSYYLGEELRLFICTLVAGMPTCAFTQAKLTRRPSLQ